MNKKLIILFLILDIIFSVYGQKKKAGIYYLKNHILSLSEELKVDSVEEDVHFTGGKDVKNWLTLPSVSVMYLIGVKERGLSLITISKKLSTPFYQAVEKQIDIGENLTSVVTFKTFNYHLKKMENIIIASTASEKNEIFFYKIENYQLIQIWSWKRFTKVDTILHFTVMKEDRLFILDEDRIIGFLYKFSMDNNSVHIRELEFLAFPEKTTKISISLSFPEPYLYGIQDGKLSIYKYKRFCFESWVGEFIKHESLKSLNVTNVIPFLSNGREYLAIAGKLGGILRIDPTDKLVHEVEIGNASEWLIIHSGPEKQNTLLFCKTLDNNIHTLYNTGFGWKSQLNPPCYKFDKELNKRIEIGTDLQCFKEKKWDGAISLEFGQLPTLIFGHRRLIGEMYHVMINVKRHILSMEELSEQGTNYWDYLSKTRSNLKDLLGDIDSNKGIEGTCDIKNMLSEIQIIAARAKEKVSDSCPNLPKINDNSVVTPSKESKEYENHIIKPEINDFDDTSRKLDGVNDVIKKSEVVHSNFHLISPDLETNSYHFQDLGQPLSMNGLPKDRDDLI